ncbi:hypothetical protein SGLAM104S_09445 [Streptomyces glaucescens]
MGGRRSTGHRGRGRGRRAAGGGQGGGRCAVARHGRRRGRGWRRHGTGGRTGTGRPGARAGSCRVVRGEEVVQTGRWLTPPRGRGCGLAAADADRAEPGDVGTASQIGRGERDAHAAPVLAGALRERRTQRQPSLAVTLPVAEAIGRHPDGAGHPVLHLHFHLGPGVRTRGAGQSHHRTHRGLHMRRGRIGGGAGEPVGGDSQLVLDALQLLVEFAEAGVQHGQPVVDEVGQLQPRVDRRGTVRVLLPAGRRHRTQRRHLVDQALLSVPAGSDGLPRVAQPLHLTPQLAGRAGTGRFGLDLHPGLGDPQPGGTDHPRPQRAGVHRTGQPGHPHPPVHGHTAAGEPAAQGALRVDHHRIECRSPPRERLSRHVLPPRCAGAERTLCRTPAVGRRRSTYGGRHGLGVYDGVRTNRARTPGGSSSVAWRTVTRGSSARCLSRNEVSSGSSRRPISRSIQPSAL